MLNPEFIDRDLSCLTLSTQLVAGYFHLEETYTCKHTRLKPNRPLPLTSFSDSGFTNSRLPPLFLLHWLYTVNSHLLTLAFASLYPVATPVSDPLPFTWVTSTAFSIGFLSLVLSGTLPFPGFFPLITKILH